MHAKQRPHPIVRYGKIQKSLAETATLLTEIRTERASKTAVSHDSITPASEEAQPPAPEGAYTPASEEANLSRSSELDMD